MKPEFLALLTAAAWGVGGYFEKKGLHLGNLPPQVGITVRTAVALVILGAVSSPHWRTLAPGGRPLVADAGRSAAASWPAPAACSASTPRSRARR